MTLLFSLRGEYLISKDHLLTEHPAEEEHPKSSGSGLNWHPPKKCCSFKDTGAYGVRIPHPLKILP